MVTKNTVIEKLDKKFDIPAADTNESDKTISIRQLSGMSPFTGVTCEAKVLRVNEATETANGNNYKMS